MLSLRRTILAAALACLSAVAVAAPAATAQPPAHAAARAAAAIPVETPVYLVETTTDSSAGIEWYGDSDYIQLTRQSGRLADKVIFHRKGDGYVIEHTEGSWPHARFWQSYTTPVVSGVRLNTRAMATVYHAVPTDSGFELSSGANQVLTYASGDVKHWVYDEYKTFAGTSGAIARFRTQK